MASQTNEQALDAAIEKQLTGTSIEELNPGVQEAPLDFHNRLYQNGFAADLTWRFLYLVPTLRRGNAYGV